MSRREHTRKAGGPRIAAFIGPLQIPYSLFTKKGVIWCHRFFRGAGAVCATRREGSGMKVRRRETGIRCRYALADSRGNCAVVHDLGALELAQGRATPGSSPKPIIWHFRLNAPQLGMSAAEAEPISVHLSSIRLLAPSLPCSLFLAISQPADPAFLLRRPYLPPAPPSPERNRS